jgi:amino acid adenylation domain-containing protein
MRSRRELEGLQIALDRYQYESRHHAQQDITIWAAVQGESIRMDLEYCTALFKPDTMERFATHFLTLLREAAANPALKLPEIEMMGQQEKQQILEQFNDTETTFTAHKMVHQLFEEQVERTPNHTALVGKGTGVGTRFIASDPGKQAAHLTYNQLNKKSHQLAHLLREKGVTPDTIVGIMVERSIRMIVGILGILKAGGAYLPIDSDYPENRIRYMLTDSKVNILVKNSKNFSNFINNENIHEVLIDDSSVSSSFSHLHLPPAPATSLAYIIYTSGSTGKPKGVMVNHQNLLVYLNAFEQEFEILPTDTMLQQASYSFDAFAEEVYPILLKGGKIAVPNKNEVKDMALLTDFILRHGVTIIDCSPLLLNQLNQLEWESPIRIFISGGDILKGEYVDNLIKKGIVYNTYGPTEATICASYYKCPDNIQQNIPIGKPIDNYCIYILDHQYRLLPICIPGELCIAGNGISRGYLNQPELTAEKFLRFYNMSYGSYRSYIYRTGDLARWLEDGNIEYLNRIDQQVKIRGYRIELQEIEHQLANHNDIKEAVVIDKEDENENKYLCAYLVPIEGKKDHDFTLSISGLREYLAGELPGYMIPTHFIKIDHIPLTTNRKIDEKALYEYDSKGNIEIGTKYVPPTNEIEKKLAAIWSEILKKKRIGIHDDFFNLGGQSILALRTVAKIQEIFNVKIPLINFFQVGTLQGIAEIISGLRPNYQDGHQRLLKKRKGLIHPFALEKVPLLRTALVQLENQRHFFFIDMHHIITDGISLDIIASEFADLYSGVELEKLPIQYKDFSQWQKKLFASDRFRKQEEYWLNIFNGEVPRLNLPLDYPRPEIRKTRGKRFQVVAGSDLTLQLKRLAAEQEVTLFMLLLAVYSILLARTCGQEDIIIGTPVSGRTHGNLTQLVGIFVNTLALRIKPENHFTFHEFLKKVKAQTLSALENQDYPFEMLVEKLNLSGDTSRNPIFDTMFTAQQAYEQEEIKTGNLTLKPSDIEYRGSIIDLILGANVTDNDIQFNFRYNIHLFDDDTIRQMAGHFIDILSWIVQAPDRQIKEIDMSVQFPANMNMEKPGLSSYTDLKQQVERFSEAQSPIEISTAREPLTQQQKEWILHEFNDSIMEYPKDMTIHQLFEQQTGAAPFRTAATYENRHLTYEELNRKSNQVALLLKEKGLESDRCVGLMVEPSIELMIGILGIIKAGGCYLPLDPRHPEEQRKFLMTDASTTMVLTKRRFQSPFLAQNAAHVIPLDALEPREVPSTLTSISRWTISAANLAYVIYTSGSTGRPKGVIVDHQAVVNRLVWMQKHYPLTPADTFLQKTTFVFDVSVIEFFSWFMGGAQLCFLEPEADIDLRKILDAIEIHNITAVSFTPTVLHTFFLSIGKEGVGKMASLKWIFCAGEQLPVGLVERWSDFPIETKLENLYGPTEATVYASYYSCNRHACVKHVPIGKPLGNTRLYVLNEHQELLPPGEVGELVLAGASLARGYLNRPGLTAEKFIPDPFFTGDKMYRTGDYAKLLPEGNMVYLGRMDSQVKIKGVRIELGEIEAVLLKHPDIRKASVIDFDDHQGVKYLAAYIVIQKDLTVKELRAYLKENVPEFMVPSAFFKVEQMPLTASGKLDRKSLPKCGTPIKAGIQYIAPRNDLEHQLANDWANILKLDKIGIDHNFFEMGGDSLRGNLLLARINNRFNAETAIKDLFDAPTIREFTKILSRSKAKKYTSITPVEKKEYYPATSAQKRLFIIHQLHKDDTSYNFAMGMIIEGSLEKERLKNTLKQLVQRHESLRTRFKMQDGEIVQKIEENPGIEMDFFAGEGWDDAYIEKIIKGDIQLSKVPREIQEVEDNLLSTVKLTKVKRKAKEI